MNVDVIGVLGGLAELAGYRLKVKREPVFRKLAKGEMPHADEVLKVDRAEYLRDQAWLAKDAVAELIEAVKSERVIYANEEKEPGWIGRVEAAKARTNAALVRVGGA